MKREGPSKWTDNDSVSENLLDADNIVEKGRVGELAVLVVQAEARVNTWYKANIKYKVVLLKLFRHKPNGSIPGQNELIKLHMDAKYS